MFGVLGLLRKRLLCMCRHSGKFISSIVHEYTVYSIQDSPESNTRAQMYCRRSPFKKNEQTRAGWWAWMAEWPDWPSTKLKSIAPLLGGWTVDLHLWSTILQHVTVPFCFSRRALFTSLYSSLFMRQGCNPETRRFSERLKHRTS